MATKILIADDERNLRNLVAGALERSGFSASCAADGQEALDALRQDAEIGLAVLDIMMPRVDGTEVLRRARGAGIRTPVIFLTSRDEEADRVLGLELGADDYLCKPFSLRELEARVKAVLRRAGARAEGQQGTEGPESPDARPNAPRGARLRLGSLEIDAECFRAWWLGAEAELTVTEFRFLQALLAEPGRVFTREQLLTRAFPNDNFVSDRSADSHIKRLRHKLCALGAPEGLIETVYGMGYRLREGEGAAR
jgi:DNA-binding response OmpR family regulator